MQTKLGMVSKMWKLENEQKLEMNVNYSIDNMCWIQIVNRFWSVLKGLMNRRKYYYHICMRSYCLNNFIIVGLISKGNYSKVNYSIVQRNRENLCLEI